MKNLLLSMFFLLLAMPAQVVADDTFVNLTPQPKKMTVGTGELTLPQSFTVSTSGLSDEMATEVSNFVAVFNAATGYAATASSSATDALFNIAVDTTLHEEGYKLDITTEGVSITAGTPAGLYFAFQTVKKILPANVMAGIKDETVTSYALPVVSIDDAPRFGYRGFMLDVARHFFTVDEVKRMIDIMSYYKMNRFHWHLSDDQGWRVEIKKYPKLTSVASIAPNSRFTDMTYGQYWINRTYGPYFYTQEQLRDVVAYAKERHIEIIPEIDMPGHFVAALVAYPEYSCTPYEARTVWIDGGISSDVLNVANPKAVQFTKDILAELMDIFPYEVIHIGGDECPTTAWESNAECTALYEELGLSSYRELQSHFIKELSDYVQEKGHRIAVWNEAITASGADTDLIKETNALVYCWNPAASSAKAAANLKLENVYTAYGPYYINRKQSTDAGEPAGAGTGSDSVRTTYAEEALPATISSTLAPYYTGVQGTFWTEHVSDRTYMEYLALPRLIAVAEAGWTPRNLKDYNSFRERVIADTVLLNYNGYNYGKHIMKSSASSSEKVMPKASTAADPIYYRIVTKATDDTRSGRCWELLREDSPLITTYSGNNAAKNRLWTNAQAEEGDAAYDYQMWFFEEDPDNAGRYALVCKALPDGSLNSTPTASSTAGRWNYDEDTKYYNFLLGENGYGESDGSYYYSIRSSSTSGMYMNASMSGQGLAVNLYSDPSSGSGGYWSCVLMTDVEEDTDLATLLEEARSLVATAKTYKGTEKVEGAYGATETAALKALTDGVDISNMSAAAQAEYAESLKTAYAAFRTSFGYLVEGQTYQFSNNVEAFAGLTITDDDHSSYLLNTDNVWTNDAWEVVSSTVGTDYTQTIQLRNVATGRYFGAPASATVGKVAYPVSIATAAKSIFLAFNDAEGDYTISSGGLNLFPIPMTSSILPGIISSGSNVGGTNAVRPMGAAWNATPVRVVTYSCQDTEGTALGTFVRSLPLTTTDLAATCPEIENYKVKSTAVTDNAVTVTYERTAYAVTTEARDKFGALISRTTTACPVGESFTVALPAPDYYTLESTNATDGTVITPTQDTIISATYSTNAYNGVRAVGDAVSKVEKGKSYLIYDNSTANDGGRKGFRTIIPTTKAVNRVLNAEGATPYSTWTLEASGTRYRVKNEYLGTYIPNVTTATTAVVMSSNPASFTFSTNTDGSWKIQGTNSVCWDGLANGSLVGWSSPGHPYLIFEYFVEPYFEITIQAVDTEDKVLSTSTELVQAGSSYTLTAETIEDYVLKEIEGNEGLSAVSDNLTVKVIYEVDPLGGIDGITTDDSATTGKGAGIYDLSGRKLNRISRAGIYISNGQKVLMK